MNDQQQRYKEMRRELMRLIQVTMRNKMILQNTLKEWQEELKHGVIDSATYVYRVKQFLQGRSAYGWNKIYDAHLTKCNEALKFYTTKSNELEESDTAEGSLGSRVAIVGVVLFIFFSLFVVTDSNITGFFIAGQEKSQVVSQDGYTVEGLRWVEIKGAKLYERCLKVNAEANFDSVTVSGKLTTAAEQEDLIFSLYTNYAEEPHVELGQCTVKEYDQVWKSCSIKYIKQVTGNYWICASVPGGDQKQIYYTLAYNVGDKRKTALWTGQNWQKLERVSYTMKAEFMNHETTASP